VRSRSLPVLLLAGALSACAPAAHFAAPAPPSSLVAGLSPAEARLEVVKRLAWGTPEAFRAARVVLEPLWPDLAWTGNGCSAPEGLGLGYRAEFAPACEVHDFAYGNLRVLEPTAANRRISDGVFYANLRAICVRKARVARPACLSAAAAYYAAVRLRGQSRFAPGT
jgi:hypothetical protein